MPASHVAIFLARCQERVEACLKQALLDLHTSPQLQQAMVYSLLDGGKRVRASLVYATAEAVGVAASEVDTPAAAVESLHAYSLVHDDLPAMDDDDLRRGKPSCHKAYNEATAILVGDALQALAFELLSDNSSNTTLRTDQRLTMVLSLARAAGARGMVAGQMLDMAAEGQQLTQSQLEILHQHKTGALISASVKLGALAGPELSNSQQQALARYASAIGLAFQIQDDILDVDGDTATLGKPHQADLARAKSTYPAVLGLPQARQLLQELYSQALIALNGFGESAFMLRELAHFIVQRNH